MTLEQISNFTQEKATWEAVEIKAKILAQEASEALTKNRLSCDHKHPNGGLAGMAFKGSYCGFICQICGCGVSYESMGY